jgi:hypothetical protein
MLKTLKLWVVALTTKDATSKEKKRANIKNEPWVSVIDVVMENTEDPTNGYFELDWNDAFIDSLRTAGYSGQTDSALVDQWFSDLCRGVIGDNI